MKLSTQNPLQNTFNLRAGEVIERDDLVYLNALDGKARKVLTTDFAAVPTIPYGSLMTNAGTGMIVAETAVSNDSGAGQLTRLSVIRSTDGSIYTVTPPSSTGGICVTKYSAAGALLGRVTLATAAGYYNQQIFFLSNGNIAVTTFYNTTNYVWHAVIDTSLNIISAFSALSEASIGGSNYYTACALSGGGYAIVHQQGINPLLSRLLTFSNTGAAVLAATTIFTRTGTSGIQYHKMAQLSDGNLVIAVSSANTVSGIGLYHGIVSTAGVSVLAFTNLDAVSATYVPELSVMAGYYCIARHNGSLQLAFVFNNAGALQGAGFSIATTQQGTNKSKLANDGTAFYLLWPNSATSYLMMSKLPITGSGYLSFSVSTQFYNWVLDGFVDYGSFVVIGNAANGYKNMIVVSLATGAAQVASTFGVSLTSQSLYTGLINGGDGAFICLYDCPSGPQTSLFVGKFSNTAVIGVALSHTVADALVAVRQAAGAYACNAVGGAASKSFDMSATTALYGNKGVMMTNGVVLKGI